MNRSIAANAVRVFAHSSHVDDDAIDAHDRRFVENRIGGSDVLAIAALERGKQSVIQRAESFGRRLQLCRLVEQIDVRVDRLTRKLFGLTQLERSFAEEVGVLGEVVDVAAEDDLHFHLRRRRRPARHDLHQSNADETKRGDRIGAFVHRHSAHEPNSFSIMAAVSSGSPILRKATRERDSIRASSNVRRPRGAWLSELYNVCSIPTWCAAASTQRRDGPSAKPSMKTMQ